MLASKASVAEVADHVAALTERAQESMREVDRRLVGVPTRAEIMEELGKKASTADLQKLGDSKAEHADVQGHLERHKQAWQAMQERIDTGLSGSTGSGCVAPCRDGNTRDMAGY